ncbi:conserved Plasmodium protein, unknown function [Plasmodium gallinaceum]|uniref:Uncharacterized protein n=1 Tax=Plasmodium gallinaceum TaxID=5849 RepID=A0A1J1GZF9_PLAGA|nr:conserved Plasmodium protein, unknown function [Plasmodium gallinaceum]CRG97854.1 conserved Plasmodium protein, unknown function [Plasmodium gallinaceum]
MIKKKDKDKNVFECIEMDEIKNIHQKGFEDNSEDDKLNFNDLSQYSPSPVSKHSLLEENKIVDNKLFESLNNINDDLKNSEINWFDDNEFDSEKYNTLSTEEKLSNLLTGENSPTLWCSNYVNAINKNNRNLINNSYDKNLSNVMNSNYKHIINNNDNSIDNNIINVNNLNDDNLINVNNLNDDNLINKNNQSDNNIINVNNLNDDNIINKNNQSDNNIINVNNLNDDNLINKNIKSDNNIININNLNDDNIINKNNQSDNNIININNLNDDNLINKNNQSDNNIINKNNQSDNNIINKNNQGDNNIINVNNLNDDNIINKNNQSDNNIINKNKLNDSNLLNRSNSKDSNHNDDYENLKNKEKDYNIDKIHNEEEIRRYEIKEEEENNIEVKEKSVNNKTHVYFNKNYDIKKKVLNKSKSLQEYLNIFPKVENTYCKNSNSLIECLSEISDRNKKILHNKLKPYRYFDYQREKENRNKIIKEKNIYNNFKHEKNSSFEKRETSIKKSYGENKFNETNLDQIEGNEIQEEKKLYNNKKELKKDLNIKNKGINYKNEFSSKNEIYKNYNELNNSNKYCSKKKGSINYNYYDNRKKKLGSDEFCFNNIKRDYSLSDKEVYNEANMSNMKKIINKIEESVEKKKIKKQLISDYENIFNKKKGLNDGTNEEKEHSITPLNNFITLSSKMHHIDKHKLRRSILYNSLKRNNTYNYTYKNISSLGNYNNLELFFKKKVYSSSDLYNIKFPIRKCLKTFKSFNRMLSKNKKYFLSEKKNRKRNSFDVYKDSCSDNSSEEIYEEKKESIYKINKKKSNKVNSEILDEMSRKGFNQMYKKTLNINHKQISGEYEFNDKSENFYDNLDVINNNNQKFYHKIPYISKTEIKKNLENNEVLDYKDEIRDYIISKRNTKENNNDNSNVDNALINSINEDKNYVSCINKQTSMSKNNMKSINECVLEEKGKDTNRILNYDEKSNEIKINNEEESMKERKVELKKEIISKNIYYMKNEEYTNRGQNEVTVKREKNSEMIVVKNEEKKIDKNDNTINEEKEINNETEEGKSEEKKKEESNTTPNVNKLKRRIIDCKNDKLKWGTTQVIIDIDDTIRSSGGYKLFNYSLGGVDAQYQRGETYPGSFQFIFELAMNKLSAESKPLLLSVLTARIPQVPITEDSYLNKKFNEVAERRGIKNWGIDCENKTLYSTLKEWVWNETRGEKKFFNFKQLHKYVIQQNSVVRYIWIGDTGDMDKQAGEMMIKTFPQRIKAVFLHHVKGKDDNTLLPSDYFIKSVPIFFFRTYIGAATKAHAYNLIDKKGLTRVLVQAVLDLEKSKVPADSSKWEDLVKDIILSNAVDELDKYNAETVNRTKKIIAQKMKEISERKLQFIS